MVARGRAGGPPARGAAANRAGGRGAAAGARGATRQAARGGARAKGSLPGKYLPEFLNVRIMSARTPLHP